MMWPKIGICLVTYDRPKEIRATISALLRLLRYPGPAQWHLADDGTDGDYLFAIDRDFPTLRFSQTVTQRAGWGANVNKAMIHLWDQVGDIIFLIEDDYVALRPIDLGPGVALLLRDKSLGLIRYDGLVGHGLDLALRESKQAGEPTINHLRVLGSSPHLNLYSNRPHLKHRRFHDRLGLYAEGQPLGETETRFAHRVKDRYAIVPQIAALADGIPRAFDHIGVTRQGTKLDKESSKGGQA